VGCLCCWAGAGGGKRAVPATAQLAGGAAGPARTRTSAQKQLLRAANSFSQHPLSTCRRGAGWCQRLAGRACVAGRPTCCSTGRQQVGWRLWRAHAWRQGASCAHLGQLGSQASAVSLGLQGARASCRRGPQLGIASHAMRSSRHSSAPGSAPACCTQLGWQRMLGCIDRCLLAALVSRAWAPRSRESDSRRAWLPAVRCCAGCGFRGKHGPGAGSATPTGRSRVARREADQTPRTSR